MTLTCTVTEKFNGKELLVFLRKEMRLSASLVRRLKSVQGIFVNSAPVYTNFIVHSGDIVSADLSAAEPPCDLVPQLGGVEVLYENNGLLAVNKPCGILVHPSHSKYTGTLSNYVSGYLEKTSGSCICHAVNRLDRDTSGVVLFAKGSHFKDLAGKALSAPDAKKEYMALVYGHFESEYGTIDLPIKRAEEHKLLRIPAEDGQRAVTHYKVLERYNGYTLIKCILETGRTHQIRVHLSEIGYPIVGDYTYSNGKNKFGVEGQMLHAYKIKFKHPTTNEEVEFKAELPKYFKDILEKLDNEI